ncbi:glycosyltransferase [Alteriqipengyuania sp. WL0013]|uniref:glycosyltransferase n=1 Tax=Alteriqipengyuania sp. WL0013 TaxID=3110773 RepID=UPI002B71451E|nr:glycosyltransferase [Alteriqipengyuania sp. WL0013]MEB3415345.1 glycosyltransferase [Alteriqipengyuania sp. WL0013]
MARHRHHAGPPALKRVLSLSTLYPNAAQPRFGTFVARSLEALAARGDWDVTVVNPIGVPPVRFGKYRALAEAAEDGAENGVEVQRPIFPLIPKFGGRFNPALLARTVLPLARRLHADRPFDLVDAQFFYPDGPAAARIAEALDLPLSIKARGADIHYWGAKAYGRKAMVRAAERADGLLAVCEALARDMAAIGLPRGKIAIHYTGLDRNRFRPLNHTQIRPRLGKELGIPLADDDLLLATVGALIPRKGQEFVIGALPELPRARLLLVGRGEHEAKLRSQAAGLGVADRVHFTGSLDHNIMPILLSAADLMVLPSSSEGLANAWIEALACGTPLVITDAGGAAEVVTSRNAGLIVRRDSADIAAAVRDLAADMPVREATVAMAERFSWEANAAALAKHFDRLTV